MMDGYLIMFCVLESMIENALLKVVSPSVCDAYF